MAQLFIPIPWVHDNFFNFLLGEILGAIDVPKALWVDEGRCSHMELGL